ncbi:MAG: sulfatase-like hydrolase/transferase [Caldilineaceae bacterium]
MKHSNILLLFTDQQRFNTIAALGNPIIKTPALDWLVQEGTSFQRCYTPSPVCVSARCATLTGMPPHKTGCVDNMAMPQDQASFMERLQALGYQTHGVGKMHFTPDSRQLWGFESRDYSEEISNDQDDFVDYLAEQGYGHVEDVHGVRSEYYYIPQPSQLPAHLHHSHWVADRSVAFLQRRDRQRPFFLWSSFIKPHPPFENPTPWNKLYRAAEMPRPFRPQNYEQALTFWNHVQNRYKYRDGGFDDQLLRTMRAAYYGCISFIDYNIGRILAALGDEIDNTLILFTADHGEFLGDYGSFGKRAMLDVAAHVPMLARWPGHFGGGVRCNTPTTLLDLWPTFLAAAGDPAPQVDPEGDDLRRIALQTERRYVYSQFSHRHTGLYLITDGRWKYSYSAADARAWLYDLHSDPYESHNLAANPLYQTEGTRLQQALIQRFQQDGYTAAVKGDQWRRYAGVDTVRQKLETDADYGLLFQDRARLQGRIDALGPYARPVTPPAGSGGQLFRDLARN